MSIPTHRKNLKARKLFDIAVQHRDLGEYKEALEVLLSIENEFQDSVGFLAALAHTYWELKDLEAAIKYFRIAVRVAPTSETVSLGLFHCLWEYGANDSAFDEMRRFLSVADSNDYRNILKEINEPDSSE